MSSASALTNGAGWRILGSGNTNYVSDNSARLPLLAATYTVEFRPAAGFVTPTNLPAPVVVGQTNVLTALYLPWTRLELPPAPESGPFTFRVRGAPGIRYAIDVSTNLAHWQPLAANAALPAEGWLYTDPASGSSRWRFYRGWALE